MKTISHRETPVGLESTIRIDEEIVAKFYGPHCVQLAEAFLGMLEAASVLKGS